MPSEAVDRVLTRLENLDCRPRGSVEKGWNARCPAHEDRDPSFTLGQGSDGRALVWCGAGCTVDQIASALQLDVRDLFEPEHEPVHQREVIARFVYVNAEGKKLIRVNKTEPKGFFQEHWTGSMWVNGTQGVLRVLYRWPEVIAGIQARKAIVIVEGEKDADALAKLGVFATCNLGGAGKWRDLYSEQMKKVADEAGVPLKVVIVQDTDSRDPKTGRYPGQEHAQAVYKSLEAV